MAVRPLVVDCMLLFGLCIITSDTLSDTTHPYCKIIWLVGVPCAQTQKAIVEQIKRMASYKLGPMSPTLIQAHHTSAVGQIEIVDFTMIPTSLPMGCRIGGTSVSEFWYSLFDNGTNYCNLRNVMQGSGLTKMPGFVEFTNEWLCLGYGVSTCK